MLTKIYMLDTNIHISIDGNRKKTNNVTYVVTSSLVVVVNLFSGCSTLCVGTCACSTMILYVWSSYILHKEKKKTKQFCLFYIVNIYILTYVIS